MWLWATFRGRGIPPQSPRDTVRVEVCRVDEMCHDIADFPEGTGARLGPGVLWQGSEVLLQPFGLGLDDFDTFCLCRHDCSLLVVACRTNGRHVPLCLWAQALPGSGDGLCCAFWCDDHGSLHGAATNRYGGR